MVSPAGHLNASQMRIELARTCTSEDPNPDNQNGKYAVVDRPQRSPPTTSKSTPFREPVARLSGKGMDVEITK